MTDRSTEIVNYGTSGLLVVGGLTLQHWIWIIGTTLAVITFAVDMYDRRSRRRRIAEEARRKEQLDLLDARIKVANARTAEMALEALRRDG